MKDFLFISSMLLAGMISWYRTGWRIFSIGNMPTPNATVGFLTILAFLMAFSSFLPFRWGLKRLWPKKYSLKILAFSAIVFASGTVLDGGWVFAHVVRYGNNHWYCQGFKHAYLHPDKGIVVRRGIDDPKDPQQFLVVKYRDCGEKWYEMSDPENFYPQKGTRIKVAGGCIPDRMISRTSSRQFQLARF